MAHKQSLMLWVERLAQVMTYSTRPICGTSMLYGQFVFAKQNNLPQKLKNPPSGVMV